MKNIQAVPEGNLLKVYLGMVLFFALLFAVITPPNQVPDEGDHFSRSYEISNGQFIPNREPILIPTGFDEIQGIKGIYTLPQRLELLFKNYDTQDKRETVTHSTYPIFVYLPQGLGIAVGRMLHLPLGWIYILGRLFNGLAYAGVLYLSLRVMPGKHWVLLLLFSTPMAIYEAGSYSPDALTNAIGLFYISLVFFMSKAESALTRKQILGLFLATWLLSHGKVNILPLGLLLLIVPWQRFGSILKKIIFLGVCLGALMVTAAVWNHLSPNPPWAYNTGSNPEAQFVYVLMYPFTFLRTLLTTLMGGWVGGLITWFGAFGWLDALMPEPILLVFLVVLVFLAALPDDDFPFSSWKKWVSGLTWFVSIAFTCMLLYLVWTRYQADYVNGLQGRYFIPYAPLVTLLIPRFLKPYQGLKRFQGLVALLTAGLVLAAATAVLVLRFYVPCGSSFYSVTACFLPEEGWQGNPVQLPPIVKDSVVEQEFAPECNQLYRVKLFADTFERLNNSFLEVSIINKETGEIIKQHTIDNRYLSEDPKIFLQFDPVSDSRGKRFVIRVTSDAVSDTAVTLHRSEGDQFHSGQLTVDGIPQEGDLIFEYGCKIGLN